MYIYPCTYVCGNAAHAIAQRMIFIYTRQQASASQVPLESASSSPSAHCDAAVRSSAHCLPPIACLCSMCACRLELSFVDQHLYGVLRLLRDFALVFELPREEGEIFAELDLRKLAALQAGMESFELGNLHLDTATLAICVIFDQLQLARVHVCSLLRLACHPVCDHGDAMLFMTPALS